jgi:hypothetical protein
MSRQLAGSEKVGWREVVTAKELVNQVEDWLVDCLETEYAICSRVIPYQVGRGRVPSTTVERG